MHSSNGCNALRLWLNVPMRHQFDLQALEHFVVLARTRNFTRASEELHLSQPALSRAIQKLEEGLGQPLFERKPREVVLTDLGELLLQKAKEILKRMEDTFAELSEASRKGRVRLGAIPTIAPYFLPGVLGEFAKQHPEVSVMVQEDTTDNLVRRCVNGEIDLAIVALPILCKELAVEALFTEELFLVVPPGHPLARKATVTIETVTGYPFVMLNEAHCLSDQIASFCRRQATQPVVVERTSQLATVQELVALDHGVSIVPDMARQVDLSDMRFYRSLSGERPMRTVALMWNPGRFQSQASKALREHLRQRSPGTKARRRVKAD